MASIQALKSYRLVNGISLIGQCNCVTESPTYFSYSQHEFRMGACTGYVSKVFLIAIIVLVKIPLSSGACNHNELVTILPDNGYFDITTGQALSGHVISSARISTEGICSIRCVRHENCTSFNYSPEMEVCELNDGNHKLNPDDLVSNESFNYHLYNWSKFKG